MHDSAKDQGGGLGTGASCQKWKADENDQKSVHGESSVKLLSVRNFSVCCLCLGDSAGERVTGVFIQTFIVLELIRYYKDLFSKSYSFKE